MLVEQILELYGVHAVSVLPVQKGYRNASHAAITTTGLHVNIIIYKREPAILATLKRANLVGDYLAGQGFPARKTRDDHIVRLKGHNQTRYAALYDYLPGETIPWDAYTMAHIKELGAYLSAMHRLLKGAPFTLENTVTDEYLAAVERMRTYLERSGVQRALNAKLGMHASVPERFTSLLTECAKLPNQQILHMDFVRGNVLFDDTPSITGVLDFEKTAWGHPIFDVARTLAFLLVDCKYKSEQQVRKYFLFSGYDKRGPGSFKITPANRQLLEELVDLFLFYDFYKFLLHNPYESLAENEHFIRTRDILLQRKVIATV